jgi:FkbM family methyltransferase
MNLDFLEIGTSNFSTCIELADDNTVGISVEPVKYYLDQLPAKENVVKVNAAIVGNTDAPPTIDVYYIPADVIKRESLDEFFVGCNRIGEYHPLHIKHNVTHLVQKDTVPLIDIRTLLQEYFVHRIKLLKIDTEGYDYNILMGFYDYVHNISEEYCPNEIQFEAVYITDKELEEIFGLYEQLGYVVVYNDRDNVTLKRNGI